MAVRILLCTAIVCVLNSQALGQLIGGILALPNGGFDESLKYNPGPLWGSIYQQHNYPRFPSRITYSGGVNLVNSRGHGLTGEASVLAGTGGRGNVKVLFPVVPDPVHKVDGFVKVDRKLDAHVNPVGPEKNTFGVTYKNPDGTTGSFTQTQVHGNPATKTLAASIPIVNSGNTLLKVTGENKIGQQQSLGVSYENKASGATASLSGVQNKVGPARGTAAASVPFANVGPATVTVEGQSTFGHGMKPDSQVGVKVSIPLD